MYKKQQHNVLIFLVIYFDNVILIRMITFVKLWLPGKFSMKNLGQTSHILGLKLYRDKPRIHLGLSKFVMSKILKDLLCTIFERGSNSENDKEIVTVFLKRSKICIS